MPDDLHEIFRAVGRLETAVEEAKAQNADIKTHLRRQDEATETNKAAAIKARQEKEERDEARFRVLDEKSTLTGGRVSVLERVMNEDVAPIVSWHRDEGAKLGGRVSILEQAEVVRAAERAKAENVKAGEDGEKRGAWRVWALLGSLVTGLVTLVGWLGWDALAPALTRFADMLTRHH